MAVGWNSFKRAVMLAAGLGAAGLISEGSVFAQDAPGQRYQIDVDKLPAPNATPSIARPVNKLDPPDPVPLRVPPGFTVNRFAGDLTHARWMTVAPNGDVFLAEPNAGRVTILRDGDGDGVAEMRATFAIGFKKPHGLAVQGDFLYVADTMGVWRLPYRAGDTKAAADPERVTPAGAFGTPGGNHWTRDIAFSADGSKLYVAIGSASNIGEDPSPRASVQVFGADGSGERPLATGLRNPVGIAIQPGSDALWVTVNERDGMGDELVPDYLTHLVDGGFYGWPYSYLGKNPQPDLADKRPDLVEKAIVPDLLFRSHSAPLGLVFYDGANFPEDYRGDAFVALHGSWNAGAPRGYMVVRVPFSDGRPRGGYEAFLTGFRIDPESAGAASVWGRPAGLALAKDGSLLVADDVANTIWRVSYKK